MRKPSHACRFCGAPLERVFIDLGTAPLSNAYLRASQLEDPEPYYPLRVLMCDECLLVQLPPYASPESIFTDYPYFSSFSDTWLEHVDRFAHESVQRFGLVGSHVVEIASNDGCLLKAFAKRGTQILGVEPARNVADVAIADGIPTLKSFFGLNVAEGMVAAGQRADLLVANNVLAQVPNINDFVAGLKVLLAPKGTLSIEVPHLVRLIADTQFDTIYHEHFSYFALTTLVRILGAHGLTVWDVEELPVHGGSIRVFARHVEQGLTEGSERVKAIQSAERGGLLSVDQFESFAERVQMAKRKLLRFLIDAREQGRRVVGYGAPAKGNTLLNYCGIGVDLLAFTVDRSPHKQHLFLPGSRLPIYGPERIFETKPDVVLILPWNLSTEISRQLSGVASWGGQLAVAIPQVKILG
jgi:C-methyltransferase C-terminal domain/Putative zinc binding domain/Methyltransferase domain